MHIQSQRPGQRQRQLAGVGGSTPTAPSPPLLSASSYLLPGCLIPASTAPLRPDSCDVCSLHEAQTRKELTSLPRPGGMESGWLVGHTGIVDNLRLWGCGHAVAPSKGQHEQGPSYRPALPCVLGLVGGATHLLRGCKGAGDGPGVVLSGLVAGRGERPAHREVCPRRVLSGAGPCWGCP